MFSKKTVFIIGAGVSSVYDFPLGSQLIAEILESRRPFKNEYSWIQEVGSHKEAVEVLITALFDARTSSIDAFLEHRIAL